MLARIFHFNVPRKSALLILACATLVAQSPPPGDDLRLQEAAQLVQEGSINRAVPILEDLVKRSPLNAEAHLMLGSALSAIPRRNEAVESLLRALELRPNHAPTCNTAGMALARLGENDAAYSVFERAVRLDPNIAQPHLHLALILAGRKEFEPAAEHIAKALELEKNSGQQAYLHFLQGKLYNAREASEEAAREFERSIELDPANAETYLALGVTRKKLLQEDKAYPLLQKAVQLNPDHPIARYQLALESLRRNRASDAVTHLLEAHRLLPDNQAVAYNLARALHKAGRDVEYGIYRKKLDNMIAVSDRARENKLRTTQIHAEAVRLEEAGDLAAALDKYRIALDFEPLNGTVRRNMALVLCRLNRWDEGIEELRNILRHDPDDVDTTRALTIALDQAKEAKRDSPQ